MLLKRLEVEWIKDINRQFTPGTMVVYDHRMYGEICSVDFCLTITGKATIEVSFWCVRDEAAELVTVRLHRNEEMRLKIC